MQSWSSTRLSILSLSTKRQTLVLVRLGLNLSATSSKNIATPDWLEKLKHLKTVPAECLYLLVIFWNDTDWRFLMYFASCVLYSWFQSHLLCWCQQIVHAFPHHNIKIIIHVHNVLEGVFFSVADPCHWHFPKPLWYTVPAVFADKSNKIIYLINAIEHISYFECIDLM